MHNILRGLETNGVSRTASGDRPEPSGDESQRWTGERRPVLFQGRHFEAEIIVLCVRWYLRFGPILRNLEEIMAERKQGNGRSLFATAFNGSCR